MSNQLEQIVDTQQNLPLFYVYKITFFSGKTYIGQHLQRRLNDKYITSSVYFKLYGNIDPIKKREILIYVKDQETLNVMETLCILADKVENKNNVNGNLGGWIMKYNPTPCPEWKKQYLSKLYKGRYVSPETRKKLSEKANGRIPKNKGKKTGKHSWNYGLKLGPMSKESREKMSKARKGKPSYSRTKETLYKQSLASSNAYKTSEKKRNALYHKGKHIYNNGIKQIMSFNCPPGFVPGRLTKQQQLPNPNFSKPLGNGSKPILCVETNTIYPNASSTGISKAGDCANGNRKTAGGYHWKWVTT